jgi:peptidoglycan/xylan/chitin deacetylase (PgdA/CDA1 family)/glycosyltransferase involved in cell wall biosynthesis
MTEPALPKTSVIVPALNAAATIAQTLDCLVGQTDTNWEAIVVEDRSRDATGQIIADYAARDPRIRFLKGPGQGVSAARNAALGLARGRRLHFLDADDWVDFDFLEHMNGAMDDRPGSVAAYCSYRRFTPDGRLTPPKCDPDLAKAPLERLARGPSVAIHAVLADRALIQRVGGFDTSLRTCEDWDFWQRLARLGGEWVYVDRIMSYYRTTLTSLSNDSAQMKADARLVIARGFSIDARVSEAPTDLAKGASPDVRNGPETSFSYFALWISAYDIGRGSPTAVDADVLRSLTPVSSRASEIASCVVEGLMVGLQTDIEGMIETWADYAPRVRQLFDLLAAEDPAPGARRQLQYAFELLLLKQATLTKPRELDLTLGLRIDLKRLTSTTPSPGIDRLHARLCMGDRLLRVLDLGLIGPMLPRDWLDIAAREFGDKCLLEIATPASLRLLMARRGLALAQRAATRVGRGGQRLARWRRWMLAPRRGSHGTIETEFYRVDQFRRVDPGEPRPEPQTQWRAVSPVLDIEVARHLVRGGVEARRAEVADTERTTCFPVLMYHSIAETGPAALAQYRTTPKCFDAQLHWLRQNGYHTIRSEELLWFIQNHEPFYGRPVMITFDDALQDFATTAWPVLRKHDFSAEVFVVTDLVGKTARWDAVYGAPAPLMDVPTIARLHAEGASFGSHLATHRRADGLPTLDLVEELARSRAALTQWLGQPVQSLAAPFGALDERLRGLARDAGYEMCFGTDERFASLWDDPFVVPRIEVRGGWTLDEFRRALGRGKCS